jgi:hypothetical protein
VGPFSRGGYSRQHKEGLDHDFDPDVILGLFGFFLPEHDDTHFFFSKSKITADFIVDTLESLWLQPMNANDGWILQLTEMLYENFANFSWNRLKTPQMMRFFVVFCRFGV